MSQVNHLQATSEEHIASPCMCELACEKKAPAMSWFVMRYKTLATTTTEDLLKSGADVFFPQSRKKCLNKRTMRYEYVTKPLVPGYIFVQTTFGKARTLSQTLGLNLWKRNVINQDESHADDPMREYSKERFYHRIPDEQMKFFKLAVELYKQDLLLADISEIDLEQDDHVEIIDGEFKGVHGYLKTTQGKYGGMVIVPVSQDSEMSGDSLCFTIEVPAEQIGIISFANGNRHASDNIRSAQRLVENYLKLYAGGEPVSEEMKKQLHRYLARFKDTRFRTDKLRASHLMLLYSIYTMLGNITLKDAVNEEINNKVLPAFDARIADARHRGRPDGTDIKEKYLKQKNKVDDAFSARKLKLKEG